MFADLLKTSADSLSGHRTFVLVSDETRATGSFRKHLTAKTLIMPVWSSEELLKFRTDFVKEEDILERYEVIGEFHAISMLQKTNGKIHLAAKL